MGWVQDQLRQLVLKLVYAKIIKDDNDTKIFAATEL